MVEIKKKAVSFGVSFLLLMTLFSGIAVAKENYSNEQIEVIGNLSHDFGKLFSDDMPDLVIGALILGLIVFLGVVLRKIMTKSTNM